MQKTFKYRINPSKKQQRLMEQILGICCELFNAAVQERRDAYRLAGKSINYHAQAIQLPAIKESREDLKAVHSQTLQEVLKRVDLAFQAFFRRVKNGDKPGFPRFRSRSRYNSFTYSQSGFSAENGRLFLSKIGHVKIKQHRPIDGQVKTCTITRCSTGKWFACFSCEIEPAILPSNADVTGIDLGLYSFAVLSNGDKIENPRFFRKEEQELTKVQRKLSAEPKWTRERKQLRRIVARVHERISNKRSNFAHQESRKIVNRFGIICIENLQVLNMLKNHHLAKSIADAAWSLFFHSLAYKAAYAGRQLVKVDPRYSSQDCSRCGSRQAMPLSARVYNCSNPRCNLQIDRDLNAARNLLALGLQCVGLRPIEAPRLAC